MKTMIIPLSDIGIDDVEIAGGKGANLGELVSAGLPVPPGFVVTADAYLAALDAAGVRDRIREMSAAVTEGTVVAAAEELRALATKVPVPDDLRTALVAAYRGMGDDVAVAVRSSATAEDGKDTSFAGMNATFTNVRGEDELLQAVHDCWLSMFGDRVVSYRCTQRIEPEPALAVIVQLMVDADRSGVMFTADPSTGDLTRIVIEGAFGLGEVVVGG